MRSFALVVLVGAVLPSLPPDESRQADRYAAILEENPSHELARERLWKLAVENHSTDALLAHFRESHTAGDQLILGYLLAESGDASAALAAFATASKLAPEDPRPWLARSELLSKQNNFPSAAEALQKATALTSEKDRPPLLLRLGKAQLAAGDSAAASGTFEQAVTLDPDNTELRQALADQYLATGNLSAARAHLRWLAAHAAPAERIDALLALSRAEESAGQLADAAAAAEQALHGLGSGHWRRPELEQRVLDLHAQIGDLHAYIDRLRHDAHDAYDWQRVAVALERTADFSGALAAWRQAHQLAPNDADFTADLAQAESDHGDLATAAKLFDQLLAGQAPRPDWVFARATVDVRRGDLTAAADRLERFAATRPKDADLANRVAEFYQTNHMLAALRKRWKDHPPTDPLREATLDFDLGAQAEAVALLNHIDLDRTADDDLAKTAKHGIALLRQHGEDRAALALAQRAASHLPNDVDLTRTIAALQAALSDREAAARTLETAAAHFPAQAEALERQAFQYLDDQETESTTGTISPPAPDKKVSAAVQARIDEFEKQWKSDGAPANALQLARWQEWSGYAPDALATLRKAIGAHPKSVVLHDAAARIAVTLGDSDYAASQLEAIRALDPSRSGEIGARLARLSAASGTPATAAKQLTAALATQPDSIDLLIELAAAKQRAGDRAGALATWREVFLKAPAEQRRIALQPLLSLAADLGETGLALQTLETTARTAAEPRDQIQAWRDAVTFATSHHQLDALRDAIDRTVTDSPHAYAPREAQAMVAEARGDDAQALAIRLAAVDLADDPERALDALIPIALEADRADIARQAAAHLVNRTDSLDAWERLAKLQASTGQKDAAHATWLAIERKFSRDPVALTAAADYHRSAGELNAADELKLAAARIEPTPPAVLLAAARIAERRGDPSSARDFLDRLLSTTRPLHEGPLPGFDDQPAEITQQAFSIALRVLGGLSDPASFEFARGPEPSDPGSEAALRLAALRFRSRLAAASDPEKLTPYEQAWARYAREDFRGTWELLKNLSSKSDHPADLERAMAWVGLRANDPAALRAWVDADPDARRRRTEFLFLALSEQLSTQPDITPTSTLDSLFPPELPATDRWRAASLFAAHSDLNAATHLGEETLPHLLPASRAAAALDLAEWQLCLSRRKAAMAALAEARHSDLPGYDQPAMIALRSQWLLASDAERQELRKAVASLPQAPAARALIAAFEDDEKTLQTETRQTVETWFAQSGNPQNALPFDAIVSGSVMQALTWNQPGLALALLDAAEKIDPAAITLRGITTMVWKEDLKWLRGVTRLASAPPRLLTFETERLPIRADLQRLVNAAGQLESLRRPAAANAVRQSMVERLPDDPTAANQGVLAASRSGDQDCAVRRIEHWIECARSSTSFDFYAERTLDLAELLLDMGDPTQAITHLDKALTLAPADARLASMKDRALKALDRTADRIALRRSLAQADPSSHLAALGRLLIRTGHEKEALALSGLSDEDRLSMAFDAARAQPDPAEACAAVRKIARAGQWRLLNEVAAQCDTDSLRDTARTELRRGLDSAKAPLDRFRCGIALARLEPPDPDALAPIFAKLQALTHHDPDLAGTFLRERFKLCHDQPGLRGWLHDQLSAEWKDGAGDSSLAEQLVQLALEEKAAPQKLSPLIDRCLAHYDPDGWTHLARACAEAGYHSVAARIFSRLVGREQDQLDLAQEFATELWKSGDHSAARRAIRPVLLAGRIDDSYALRAGEFFIDVGRDQEATDTYATLAEHDRSASQSEAWLKLAALAREEGRLDTAKLWLATAFQNPTNLAWSEIADWLLAQPDLASRDPEKPPFSIADFGWKRVRLEVASRLSMHGKHALALAWLPPSLLREPQAAAILLQAGKDPQLDERVRSIWETGIAQLPASATLDLGYARYLADRATRSTPGDALALLAEANQRAPFDFSIARSLAKDMLADHRPADASRVLDAVIHEEIPAADRAEARALLEKCESIESLPPRADAS